MSVVIKSGKQFLEDNVLKQTNGYQKLPNGMVIQWWRQTGVAIDTNNKSATFPIPFENAVFMIQGTNSRSSPISGTYEIQIDSDTISLTGFQFNMDFDTNTTGADNTLHWFAIGY